MRLTQVELWFKMKTKEMSHSLKEIHYKSPVLTNSIETKK
jgi:hypothetical protein